MSERASDARDRGIARSDAAQQGTSAVKPEVVQGCEPLHWIEIRLRDQFGRPVPAEAYEVVDSAGTRYTGNLDANGLARIAPIPAGTCQVGFPNLDRRSWEPGGDP
jgi:hypothetical protein